MSLQPALHEQVVAFTGKLASLTRREAVQWIRARGGRFSPEVTRRTSLLVIGQEGWPLQKDGRLTNKLRRARLLKRRGHGLTITTEDAFLTLLGRDRDEVHGRYSLSQLSRLLEVPGDRLRSWLRIGLIQPAETAAGLAYFDFQQVAGAKTLCELVRAGVSAERLRRSFEQLGHWLGDVQAPLTQVAVLERDGELLVRLEDGRLAESTGQLRFDFADPGSVVTAHSLKSARTEDRFEQGCWHESAGQPAEAAECYRAALLQSGPTAEICFNLANALYRLGQKGQAAERYRQAVEMDGEFAEAWNNLGNVLAELGEWSEAVAALRRALELEPFYADAHYNLADLLDQLGRAREARPHWQAYLKADSHTAWAAHARTKLQAAR